MVPSRVWLCWAVAPAASMAFGAAFAQAPSQPPQAAPLQAPALQAPVPQAPVTQAPAPQASAPEAHDHGAAGIPASGAPARTAAPADAYNYIGWPQDKTVIRSTRFKVWFGARNIGVAPAGVVMAGTGHHHLLVDTPMPTDMSVAIPNDRNHLHFGSGQTETMLELPPGKHTLQLLMGDAAHVPHDPPVHSAQITIEIRAAEPRTAPEPRTAAQ